MNICIGPAPGLYKRWQLLLRGALISFGVVILLGGAALMSDPHVGTGELQRLQQLIENGDFTDYTLDDFQRMNELQRLLDDPNRINLETEGRLLLTAGLHLFAACALLIATQNLVHWLWLGSDSKHTKLN